ncbi:MAG: carboxypeptidase regulatory-like domain-containing protein [Planctomycetes bacterium]|nr:carboxypeptidase regulatory-like domain-containing protein [Planctomycetota bacterium]
MSRTLVLVLVLLALGAGVLYLVLGTEPAAAPSGDRAPVVEETGAAREERPQLERDAAKTARNTEQTARSNAALERGTFEIVGRVLDETGAPALPIELDPNESHESAADAVKPAVSIVARAASQAPRSAKPDAKGAFALRGLVAGEWRVRASVRGYHDEDVVFRLDAGTPRVERDLVLRKITWAVVEVVARDAARVGAEARASAEDALVERLALDGMLYFARQEPDLSASPWFGAPDVVVQERHLAPWKAQGTDLVFRARCRVEPDELRGGFFASFALGATSLETKSITDLAQPTRFEVDWTTYLRGFARLAVRVVAAGNGSPIEGARIELRRAADALVEAESGLENGTTDAKGELRLAFLRPGAVRVVVVAPEREAAERDVLLRAGEAVDLGTIELGAPVVARGRVVDASGAPVHVQVELVIDGLGAQDGALRASTDADGAFLVRGLARRAYLLRLVQPSTHAAEPLAVDARQGSVAGIVVRTREGTRTTFELAPPKEREYDVDVLDAEGRAIATALRTGGTGNVLFLLPGAYTLRLRDGATKLGERALTVGAEPQVVEVEAP